MVHGDRSERVGVRLSPEEAAVVAQVSEETGLSASDIVRQAIRKTYADRFAAISKKTKPKR